MSNYFTYWHITAPVFIRPADASSLYLSAATTKLTQEFNSFIASRQSLAVFSGAAGSGKTTLLRWLATTVPMKSHDVFLVTLLGRESNSGWLLPRIATFFKTTIVGTVETGRWVETLKTGLAQLSNEGRYLVVCIDAAHLISSDDAIADLEAFYNLQELTDPRVSFILSGNSELIERVKKNQSLAVRVSSYLMTGPMTRPELDDYVALRMKQAGIAVTFDPEVLNQMYQQSNGNFFSTNMVLEKCLIAAAAKGSKRITTFISEQAIQTMTQNRESHQPVVQISAAPNASTPASSTLAPPIEKGTDHFEKGLRIEQPGQNKNEHNKSGKIKLSSLFKQDDD